MTLSLAVFRSSDGRLDVARQSKLARADSSCDGASAAHHRTDVKPFSFVDRDLKKVKERTEKVKETKQVCHYLSRFLKHPYINDKLLPLQKSRGFPEMLRAYPSNNGVVVRSFSVMFGMLIYGDLTLFAATRSCSDEGAALLVRCSSETPAFSLSRASSCSQASSSASCPYQIHPAHGRAHYDV